MDVDPLRIGHHLSPPATRARGSSARSARSGQRGGRRDGRRPARCRRRQPQPIRSKPAWAHLCGAAPIPASSGKATRWRLDQGGDRQAKSAHYIAGCSTPTDCLLDQLVGLPPRSADARLAKLRAHRLPQWVHGHPQSVVKLHSRAAHGGGESNKSGRATSPLAPGPRSAPLHPPPPRV